MQPVRGGHAEHGLDLGEGPEPPAVQVRRLLDADQPRARGVAVAGPVGGDRRLERLGLEHAGRALDDRDDRSREGGRPTRLGRQRMRVATQQQLVAAGPDVQPDGDLVAHRPAGEEHRRLVAEQLGDARLEREHRRVLAALLVADLRLGHRAAHGRRRLRLGVGPEVDETGHGAEPTASAVGGDEQALLLDDVQRERLVADAVEDDGEHVVLDPLHRPRAPFGVLDARAERRTARPRWPPRWSRARRRRRRTSRTAARTARRSSPAGTRGGSRPPPRSRASSPRASGRRPRGRPRRARPRRPQPSGSPSRWAASICPSSLTSMSPASSSRCTAVATRVRDSPRSSRSAAGSTGPSTARSARAMRSSVSCSILPEAKNRRRPTSSGR